MALVAEGFGEGVFDFGLVVAFETVFEAAFEADLDLEIGVFTLENERNRVRSEENMFFHFQFNRSWKLLGPQFIPFNCICTQLT